MVNLNKVIKQDNGGQDYTDGNRWWRLPGYESFSLEAFKNILVNLGIIRARLSLPYDKRTTRTRERAYVENTEFFFDTTIEEEKLVLKFEHVTVFDEIEYGKWKTVMNKRRNVSVNVWRDGEFGVSVDGEPQARIQIHL